MPISFDRTFWPKRFEQGFLLEPEFEFGTGAGMLGLWTGWGPAGLGWAGCARTGLGGGGGHCRLGFRMANSNEQVLRFRV